MDYTDALAIVGLALMCAALTSLWGWEWAALVTGVLFTLGAVGGEVRGPKRR